MKFFAGTSGLVLPVANKQAFPEEFKAGTRLTYYASLFNSIEINSSFYRVPRPATFARWAGEVPEGFRFTVKLWRGITHTPGLQFLPMDLNKFLDAAGELGSKKGCLLIQLPPGTQADRAPQLERLLERIVSADMGDGSETGWGGDAGWRIAVEFRHRSWYGPETDELLKRYRAGLVLHDMPASRVDRPGGRTSFIYVRYHGIAGDYRGGYGDDLLRGDAEKVRTWLGEGKEVFVYFNNTIGDALHNVQALSRWVVQP
jgi:uncharacterized protein YecE (DUF72 family)